MLIIKGCSYTQRLNDEINIKCALKFHYQIIYCIFVFC